MKILKEIVIVGAGEQGRIILDYLSLLTNEFKVKGFLDDIREGEVNGFPILGKIDSANISENYSYFVALGESVRRRSIIMKYLFNNKLETIMHPSSLISKSAKIGSGTSVGIKSIVCNETTVGKGVLIDTGAIIEHDNRIGNFVTISPRATTLGGVTIGEASWIGAGAVVGEDLTIGKNSIVGMSALVTKDVPDNVVVYGIPAKIVKKIPIKE